MSEANTAWENGQRVYFADPFGDALTEESAPVKGRVIAWPSAEEPVLELTAISASAAARAANEGRLETMEVIAGAGLEPVWIATRILEAAMLSGALPSGAAWPGRPVAQALMGGYAAALPVIGRLLYGDRRKARVAAAQSRIRGVCGRHGWSPERREVGELFRDSGIQGLREDEEAELEAVAALARSRLLRWLCAEESATALVQRWWAMAWTAHRSVIGPLSGEDIGQICHFRRATVHEWVVRYLTDPSRTVTGVKIEVAGMKPDSATAGYAANAAQHCPRRRTEGAAGLTGSATAQLEAADERQLEAYRTQQRAAWEARQVERDAAIFEEMVARRRRRSD